jgi:filamentous hemagglutinin family protein
MTRLAATIVAGTVWLLAATVGRAGQVALDKSFGPGGPLPGPNYTIPDTVGRTVGNNLFHSFSRFNLDTGDIATFTGPANIQNVISRVTGGSASTIDGTIQCGIAGANFFFINPFGVMFGPNAKVDVSGSFAVTTADYVKLADGGRFDARHPANDVLTTAPVSAFGFLGPTVAPIVMQGPSADTPTTVLAELADGRSLFVVGGDIHLDNVQLTAASGRIVLLSVNSAGEAGVDVDNLHASIDTSSFSQLGNIELTTFTTLDVSGDPGGRIDIQAQNLTADDLSMGAFSLGIQDGLGIDFAVRDAIRLRGSTSIFLDAFDVGAAGGLSMTARSISLLGEPVTGAGAVNIATDTFGPGGAGDIAIHADTFVMRNGAVVSAGTDAAGDGGSIDITAKSILMEGQQSTAVLSTTSFEGKPGNITILADTLSLKADSKITAEAFGPSPAGAIIITAKHVLVDDLGGSQGGFAGISVNSETSGLTSGQSAGDIVINADTLDLRNGSRISSSSASDSPGGDIFVNATHEIRLAGSRIETQAGGDGGNVHLAAPVFVYLLDSQITAASINGNGGNITIDPQLVVMDNSGLSASAIHGNGGNVNVVSVFFLQSESAVDVSSEFGLQGTVTITALDAQLSGSLMPLTAEPIDAETLLRPDCAVRLPGGVSSFSTLGRGGVPVEPDALLPAIPGVGQGDAE